MVYNIWYYDPVQGNTYEQIRADSRKDAIANFYTRHGATVQITEIERVY